MTSAPPDSPRLTAPTLGGLFAALYIVGYLAPETWWGTHFLAFLPRAASTFLVVAAGLLFLVPEFFAGRSWSPPSLEGPRGRTLLIAGALLTAVVYGQLSVQTDIYGDARRHLERVDTYLEQGTPLLSQWRIWHPRGAEFFVLGIVQVMAGVLGWEPATAFGAFNAIMGFVFVVVWWTFVRETVSDPKASLLLMLIGAASPFALVFTDHAEIYAASVVGALIFLATAMRYVRTGKGFWLQIPALVLAIATHFGHLTMVIPWILTWRLRRARSQGKNELSWRRSVAPVCGGLLLIATIYYFFITEDHAVTHWVDPENLTEDIFLPLMTNSETAVRPYTLFSASHLLDFVNAILLWSIPALFLAVTVLWNGRPRRRSPDVMLATVTLGLYLGLLFVTNPVLSMPRDWDLFVLAAPALLMFTTILVAHRASVLRRATGPALALLVLSWSSFAVNHHAPSLSPRLESIGIHAYRTYWKGSSYIVNVALKMVADDPNELLRRRTGVIAKIRDDAQALPDVELANLVQRVGDLYLQQEMPEQAIAHYEDAHRIDSTIERPIYGLALCYLKLGAPDRAYGYAHALAEIDPENARYQGMAFGLAADLKQREDALLFGGRYVELEPEDTAARGRLESIRAAQAN